MSHKNEILKVASKNFRPSIRIDDVLWHYNLEKLNLTLLKQKPKRAK